MNLNFVFMVLIVVILVCGWKHIPELARGVKKGWDNLGGGGPRLRF